MPTARTDVEDGAPALEDGASAVESDYGTDVDEQEFDNLLRPKPERPLDDIVLTSIEQDPVTEHAFIHLRSSGHEPKQSTGNGTTALLPNTVTTEIEYRRLSYTPVRQTREETKAVSKAIPSDDRSPLERFRSHPKKPLSVTDIVSPAWCEQQYLFSLSKHGRIQQTPAMKQGSKVHKVLEEQVHTTVRIEVKSREDMFGLKLWNVIQGLRTLRATGLTREMAVWGVIDGEIINGVIDEVTTQCPGEAYEAALLQRKDGLTARKKKEIKLETNQTTLGAFLGTSEQPSQKDHIPTFYLVDVKTRQSRTLPADDGRLRPTQMQLMLYHRLLSSLASDTVDKSAIFDRYKLDGAAMFSDVFIAEVSKLDLSSYFTLDEGEERQDSVTELLANNSLNALWSYMMAEFSKTFPDPTSCLSSVLVAEFRTASDGELLGKRYFEFDAARLDAYVHDEMSWWKGERPAKGVDIEEAFKCRICNFAEECSWRKEKYEQAVQRTRQRKAASQSISNG